VGVFDLHQAILLKCGERKKGGKFMASYRFSQYRQSAPLLGPVDQETGVLGACQFLGRPVSSSDDGA
ncbi:MAG: hypothetical protein ACKPKO_47055, partial [Candidatus Fonsibacter sp.]